MPASATAVVVDLTGTGPPEATHVVHDGRWRHVPRPEGSGRQTVPVRTRATGAPAIAAGGHDRFAVVAFARTTATRGRAGVSVAAGRSPGGTGPPARP